MINSHHRLWGQEKKNVVFLKLYTAFGLTELLWGLCAQDTNEFPQEWPSQHDIWQADSSKGPCYQHLWPGVICWHQAVLSTYLILTLLILLTLNSSTCSETEQMNHFLCGQRNSSENTYGEADFLLLHAGIVMWYGQSLYFMCVMYSCKFGCVNVGVYFIL